MPYCKTQVIAHACPNTCATPNIIALSELNIALTNQNLAE